MNLHHRLICAAIVGLVLSSSGSAKPATRAPQRTWEVGPVINGRNYSLGPSRVSSSSAGVSVAIGPQAEPHYVSFRHGSLQGKRVIRMRFRVEGPNGAIIHGAKCGTGSPSGVTLFFQRGDDDWTSDGGRWWATFATVPLSGPLRDTEIVAPLDANWTSVAIMTAANNPYDFAAAKGAADRVGFTFGNCEGFGHGARATVPVRLVVTRFEVR